MTNAKEIRTIIGIAGNVTAILLLILQMPAFIGIYKKKSVERLEPDVLVIKVMEFSLWALYGLVDEDGILVTTVYGIAFVFEASFLAVILIYYDDKSRRNNFCMCLWVEFTFVAMLCVLTLLQLDINLSTRRTIVGVVCSAISIFTYAIQATCAIEITVKTTSLEYMPPLWLSFGGFINIGIWAAYSLIYKIDIYILISTGFGILVYTSRLIVYACYYNSTHKAVHPSEDKTQIGKITQQIALMIIPWR